LERLWKEKFESLSRKLHIENCEVKDFVLRDMPDGVWKKSIGICDLKRIQDNCGNEMQGMEYQF
jgi:hypothetical protein